jgi:hypothetical protein
LLIPFVLPSRLAFGRRFALTAATVAGMLIFVVPWTIHNWREHNAFLPFSTSTAILWQGSPEFFHAWQSGRNLMSIWEQELNADVNGGHDPFTVEGDRYFTRRAIASIRSEPWIYLKYSVMKAVFLWVGHPAIDWAGGLYDWRAMREWFSLWETAGIFFSRLAFPLLSVLAVIRLRNQIRPFLPLLVFPFYFTLIHALTYAEVRYGEVLHPLLAVVIAAAVAVTARTRSFP